jgi:peptidoglycan/xylan/chitin deacetylase (PgdA/CDA1 family)
MTSSKYTSYLLIIGLVCLLWLEFGAVTVFCRDEESGYSNINCFVYHRFGDHRYPSTNITTADFQKHLKYLKDNTFHVITLGDALDLLQNDRIIPDKTVVLTIDDGYASFYRQGMPLLRQYGFAATLFVNSGLVGSADFMSWTELRQLQREGIEIGNHSHSHAHFVDFSPAQQVVRFREDLKQSQQLFVEKLGEAPKLYSYPYGEYSLSMLPVLKEEGLIGAAAQNSGVISTFSNFFALPRFPVAGKYASLERFKEKAAMKALPVEVLGEYDHIFTGGIPPTLKLRLIQPGVVDTQHFQCFVADSRECTLQFEKDSNIISIKSNHPFRSRRTLYTITAPSASTSDSWYWFSHLWIEPTLQ